MAHSSASPSRPCLLRPRTLGGAGVGFMIAAATVSGTATTAQAQDYIVQPGDTVSHIALRTSTTVRQIVTANGLDERATIRIGQVLTIPEAALPAVPQTTTASHLVVRGDTVWALARAHGSTIEAIVAANGLDPRATIRIGQTLTIPVPAAAGAPASPATAAAGPPAPTVSHLVVRGDTVSALALAHRSTVAAIVAANGLDSRATILVGQHLTIPGAAAAAPGSGLAPTTGLVGDTFAGRTYPTATVAAANQNKAALLAAAIPSRADMRALVAAVAREMGVDPALAQAIAYQESGFNHASVSPANAIGTMQVIPTSGQWASEIVGRELNLLDPRDNVVAGVAILGRLIATSPDLPTAIAGYYQGQRSVRENGMFADTRRYVAAVQSLIPRYA
jgi:LysM repeat protein